MARIKGRDTSPERAIAAALALERIVEYECHPSDLPGRPDFVFRDQRVVVFVDGDFWHGWRFPIWRDKLSEKWEAKIEATRRRDARNCRRLRRTGWTVVRIWEHQVERDLLACIRRILLHVKRQGLP
jgi:DNA mismatch endonuclease (patch repair protein)